MYFLSGWLALMVTLSVAQSAQASGIGVSPVRVVMPAGQRSTAITLSNGGDGVQRVQAEVFRWTRVNGEDVLTPDAQVLLNPPLFEMAPGGSQIVRIGFRQGAQPPADRETAYRVFFQEVPREQPVDGRRLQMVLRIGVPVFVTPAALKKNLHWNASAADAGLQVELHNQGNTHVRIAELRVSQPPAGAEQSAPGFAYVFPGETHRWSLADANGVAQGPLLLDALTDSGRVHVELPLSAH